MKSSRILLPSGKGAGAGRSGRRRRHLAPAKLKATMTGDTLAAKGAAS